jgi:hypothetical protein
MLTVEELLAILNLNEAWLRRVLGTDETYINRLVVVGNRGLKPNASRFGAI